jgi:hypothetical protein
MERELLPTGEVDCVIGLFVSNEHFWLTIAARSPRSQASHPRVDHA